MFDVQREDHLISFEDISNLREYFHLSEQEKSKREESLSLIEEAQG